MPVDNDFLDAVFPLQPDPVAIDPVNHWENIAKKISKTKSRKSVAIEYLIFLDDGQGNPVFTMDVDGKIECKETIHAHKAGRAFMKQVRRDGLNLLEFQQMYYEANNELKRLRRLVDDLEEELAMLECKK